VEWSLLSCGRSGHVTYAPDEPELREQLSAPTAGGEAWQCLRCAVFVPGQPQGTGPAAQAPRPRRGKEVRSSVILRVFAVERFVRGVLVGALAFVLWHFRGSRQSIEHAFDREQPAIRSLFRDFGYNIDHSKLVGLIHHALTLSNGTIELIVAVLVLYAAVEFTEAAGLWLERRWGEYFAMVATSLGLPYELYELANGLSVFKLLLFGVNLALVLYLVITKRLFGVRGGKAAYEARLRSESVLEAAAVAAAGKTAAKAAAARTGAAARPAGAPQPGGGSAG
jgi:uncharacterized membrane protein (DUF2068 family)